MRFLYVANCGLPDTAAGIRIYNIAVLLRELGHTVSFLCGIRNTSEHICYDGFDYYFDKQYSQFSRLLNLLFGTRLKKRMKQMIKEKKFDAIIAYNDVDGISKLAKKINVRFYSDVTEWYSFSIFNKISDNIASLKTSYRIKNIDRYSFGIIAISDYLYQYYKKINNNVIRIPPLFSVNSTFNSAKKNKRINLIYCGSPGRKDDLLEVIKAVIVYNKRDCVFNLYLVGVSSKQLSKKLKTNKIPSFIHALGQIKHDSVEMYYSLSDFSILFRKKRRYSRAGYSTKFAESLSHGIPVICNKVGGADLDIIDGWNGFLIESKSRNSILALLKKISVLNCDKLNDMKTNAINFAKKAYDKKNYNDELQKMINGEL